MEKAGNSWQPPRLARGKEEFRSDSWKNCLHTPILFLVLSRRGPKPSHPHTLFLYVRGSWMDCLHFLLLFPVLSWRAPRTNTGQPPSLVPVLEEFVDDLSPLPIPASEGREDVPSLPAVSRRLCHRSPQTHQKVPAVFALCL
ncbi:hypothetical protein GOODEAATRI_012014 [Goodea atripinnis]|uniref:Uncharacterized protein n=1 Tax=Goodea atripinnis TaxID=208336 RepID=A0ABV0PDG0_9TELE